jgi:hypothetical protein
MCGQRKESPCSIPGTADMNTEVDPKFVITSYSFTRLKIEGIQSVCRDCGSKIREMQEEVWKKHERIASQEIKRLIPLRKLKQ